MAFDAFTVMGVVFALLCSGWLYGFWAIAQLKPTLLTRDEAKQEIVRCAYRATMPCSLDASHDNAIYMYTLMYKYAIKSPEIIDVIRQRGDHQVADQLVMDKF